MVSPACLSSPVWRCRALRPAAIGVKRIYGSVDDNLSDAIVYGMLDWARPD